MQIVIKGKNMEVPEQLREYVQKKLGKLDRYLDTITSANVELTREKTKSAEDRHVVQVTLVANGTILRGEETSEDLHSAIDAVADVMHRQVSRYKGKLSRKPRGNSHKELEPEGLAPLSDYEWPERSIVKTKQFAVKPLTVDEAAEQMELLGHDFFVFFNCSSEQVNVLYRRKDGDYGLIEPEMA